jgi:hypothetical protein
MDVQMEPAALRATRADCVQPDFGTGRSGPRAAATAGVTVMVWLVAGWLVTAGSAVLLTDCASGCLRRGLDRLGLDSGVAWTRIWPAR